MIFGEVYLFQNQWFYVAVFFKWKNITSGSYTDRFMIPSLIHMDEKWRETWPKAGEESRLFYAFFSCNMFNSTNN